jgi:hypothetical protein
VGFVFVRKWWDAIFQGIFSVVNYTTIYNNLQQKMPANLFVKSVILNAVNKVITLNI